MVTIVMDDKSSSKPIPSLKRKADEANAPSEVAGASSTATATASAPADNTTTTKDKDPTTTAPTTTSATTPMPFKAPKHPTSEIKKRTAAQSLANLFSSGSDSFESSDDRVADLMGASKDDSADEGAEGSAVAPAVGAVDGGGSATATVAVAAVKVAEGGITAVTEEPVVGFASPRKKSRTTSPEKSPIKMDPVPHSPIQSPASMSRRSTRGATAAAAALAIAVADKEAMDEERDILLKTERIPATTPQRVAGANVLASLSDSKMNAIVDMKPPPPLPSIAEIGTAAGNVQHDYLLQNLVQASKVTSPLPVPFNKGNLLNKFTHDQPLPQLMVPTSVPIAPPQPPPQPSKSRKEKSLGVLCANFMELFKNAPPNRDNNGTVIEICQVAEHLAVKRRRIYDVINILESIDIVCRVKKNTYRWHGRDGLPRFFAELQKAGLQERAAKAAAIAAGADPALQIQNAKTKGMAQTCQKLIQIFLVTGRVEIGLTDAAEEVLGPLSPAEEANSQRAMKTKVRRMYDIANVLQSIGILQKENVGSTSLQNKPSFRWVYHILPCDVANYLGMPFVYAPATHPTAGELPAPMAVAVPPPMAVAIPMTAPLAAVNSVPGADATALPALPPMAVLVPQALPPAGTTAPALPPMTVLPPPAGTAAPALPPMTILPPPTVTAPVPITVMSPSAAAAVASLNPPPETEEEAPAPTAVLPPPAPMAVLPPPAATVVMKPSPVAAPPPTASADGNSGLAPVTPEEIANSQTVLPKAPTPPAKAPTPPVVVGEQVYEV